MNRTAQSIFSVVTDLAYFVTVVLLGRWGVVQGQAIVALLGFYGAGRVGIGMRKTEARAAYIEGVASVSQEMKAVRDDDDSEPPPAAPPRRAPGRPIYLPPIDPRTRMLDLDETIPGGSNA